MRVVREQDGSSKGSKGSMSSMGSKGLYNPSLLLTTPNYSTLLLTHTTLPTPPTPTYPIPDTINIIINYY